MDRQSVVKAFESNGGPGIGAPCREFRIYRPNGTLSVIYVTTFVTDEKAIAEAKKIARFGFQVEMWRGGTRIGQLSERRLPKLGPRRLSREGA